MDLLSQKTHHYNRKFYNKFSYKVSLLIKGAGCFRLYNVDEIKTMLSSGFTGRKYYMEQMFNNRDQVFELIDFIKDNNLENITKRVERDYIDFYTNDRNVYDLMSQKFLTILKHRFEPRPGVEISEDSESTIFVSKLPHGRYEYKVYLRPHKMKGDIEAKQSYLDWIDTQGDKIKISPAVKKWFLETDWNWDRRYIHVDTQSTLLMLSMRGTEIIGKVYKHCIVDK
jgi:hypothetical protein